MANPIQPIQMLATRFEYFPRQFRLNNETLNVVAIERTETSHKQFYFQVRTDDGRRFDVIQTLKTKKWQASLVSAPKIKA